MLNIEDYRKRMIPAEHWKLLRDVPGWEGVLLYDQLDIAMDRPLRFYHRFHNVLMNSPVIIPLQVHRENSAKSNQKKSVNVKPMFRNRVQFLHKGKLVHFNCAQLTMLCLTGFTIEDRRHWVVDHIDGNPLNDRPSNLQVISQRENIRRSEKCQAHIRRIQHLGTVAAAAARRARREKGGTAQ